MADATPHQSFDPRHAAVRVVSHFEMGAICPAEMWAQLAEVLSMGDAEAILEALPQKLKAELRQSYRERPLSFLVLRGNPLRRRLRRWCRSA